MMQAADPVYVREYGSKTEFYLTKWDGWHPGPKFKYFFDNASKDTWEWLNEATSLADFKRRIKQRMYWDGIQRTMGTPESRFRALISFENGAIFPSRAYEDTPDDVDGEAIWHKHVSMMFAVLTSCFDLEYQKAMSGGVTDILGPQRYRALAGIKEAFVAATALWVEVNDALRATPSVVVEDILPNPAVLSTRIVVPRGTNPGPQGAIHRTHALTEAMPSDSMPEVWRAVIKGTDPDTDDPSQWARPTVDPTDPVETVHRGDRYFKTVPSYYHIDGPDGNAYVPIYRMGRIYYPEGMRDTTTCFTYPQITKQAYSTTADLIVGYSELKGPPIDFYVDPEADVQPSLPILGLRVLSPGTMGYGRYDEICSSLAVSHLDPSHPYTMLLAKLYDARHRYAQLGLIRVGVRHDDMLHLQSKYVKAMLALKSIAAATDIPIKLWQNHMVQPNFRTLKSLKKANSHLIQSMVRLLSDFDDITDPRIGKVYDIDFHMSLKPERFLHPVMTPQIVPEVLMALPASRVLMPTGRTQSMRALCAIFPDVGSARS